MKIAVAALLRLRSHLNTVVLTLPSVVPGKLGTFVAARSLQNTGLSEIAVTALLRLRFLINTLPLALPSVVPQEPRTFLAAISPQNTGSSENRSYCAASSPLRSRTRSCSYFHP